MKKIIVLSVISALMLMTSCQDDLDVNDEWQNIPVVYALLSQADTIHYVKVNKAFLGEAPAAAMAQESDSLFYDDVQVWVNKIENGTVRQRIDFTAIDSIPKPDGYFASDRNTLYVWEGNIQASSPSGNAYEYELNVYIPSINMTCKSAESIGLVDNVRITNPTPNRQIALSHYENGRVESEYRTGDNGRLYQMVFRFYYIEVNEATGDTIKDIAPIEISLSEDEVSGSGAEIKKEFTVSQFYQLVGDNIPVKEGYTRFARYPYSVEFTLYAADRFYKTYSEVSAPSSGIVQEKPFFTNIENGIGLFAARYQTSIENKITGASLDSLARGIYTKHLNFATKDHPYYQDDFLSQ